MAKPVKKSKKGGRTVSIDFSGTSESQIKKVPDGEYLAKVSDVTSEVGADSGKPYLKWVFEIIEHPDKKVNGAKIWHNTSLQPQALFNLRATLEAMDVEVPESIVNLNLDDYMGLELGVAVENETYEGKKRPKISDVFTVADLYSEEDEEDEDEDEEDEDEEEDDEDDDEEEKDFEGDIPYSEMTLDELKDLCEERDIEVPKKPKAKKLIALLEEYDEEEDL